MTSALLVHLKSVKIIPATFLRILLHLVEDQHSIGFNLHDVTCNINFTKSMYCITYKYPYLHPKESDSDQQID